jgi:hypothetical protein
MWENGSPWWTLEQVGNPNAPREQWNALQMVWGMQAHRMENGGSLVRPEDAVKRARAELEKQKVNTSAPAGEGMSGKDFSKAQKALFAELNSLAQEGLKDSSDTSMRKVGFDKLDPGETALLIHDPDPRSAYRGPVQERATGPRVASRAVSTWLQPRLSRIGCEVFPSSRSHVLRVVQDGIHSQRPHTGVYDGNLHGRAGRGAADADALGRGEQGGHQADDVAQGWRARGAGPSRDHEGPPSGDHNCTGHLGGDDEHQVASGRSASDSRQSSRCRLS